MKQLSKQIFIITLIVLRLPATYGQSGIYMSAADFQKNVLSYKTDCEKYKQTIHTHDFFSNGRSIVVSEKGQKHKLPKSTVYGFRNCAGEVYRFYKNTSYRVMEARAVYVYTQQANITEVKGFKVVNRYYFSTGPNGNIVPMTIENLRFAYRNNEKISDMIDTHFGTGEVTEYDAVHNMYKINYLISRLDNK